MQASEASEKEIIAWLAGLVEGEAYCGDGGVGRPTITIRMTDRDVIYRAAHAVNRLLPPVGEERILNPGGPYRGTREHYLDYWRLDVRLRRALELGRLLYPHLGTRRRAQLEQFGVHSA